MPDDSSIETHFATEEDEASVNSIGASLTDGAVQVDNEAKPFLREKFKAFKQFFSKKQKTTKPSKDSSQTKVDPTIRENSVETNEQKKAEIVLPKYRSSEEGLSSKEEKTEIEPVNELRENPSADSAKSDDPVKVVKKVKNPSRKKSKKGRANKVEKTKNRIKTIFRIKKNVAAAVGDEQKRLLAELSKLPSSSKEKTVPLIDKIYRDNRVLLEDFRNREKIKVPYLPKLPTIFEKRPKRTVASTNTNVEEGSPKLRATNTREGYKFLNKVGGLATRPNSADLKAARAIVLQNDLRKRDIAGGFVGKRMEF